MRPRRVAHGFTGPSDIAGNGAGQTGDHRTLDALGDLRDGLEIAVRSDREAGFDDIDAHGVEHLGDLDLLLESHGGAGALLAVAQGGVEDHDAVLVGLVRGSHGNDPLVSAPCGALEGLAFLRSPECPGNNCPAGAQGPIRSRSPPVSRLGMDAAGIASEPAADATSP